MSQLIWKLRATRLETKQHWLAKNGHNQTTIQLSGGLETQMAEK